MISRPSIPDGPDRAAFWHGGSMKNQLVRWTALAIAFAIAAASLAACGAPAAPGPTPASTEAAPAVAGVPVRLELGTYYNITPAQLAEMLKHKDFYFVNVHVPYAGELEQTDAFIPFQSTETQRVTDYPADKSAKIVLYCRSGRMSTIVAQEQVKAGYTNVWNLDGGFEAWEQAGYSVIQK